MPFNHSAVIIELNNTAVSLLQHGSHRSAVAVMETAIQVLRDVSLRSPDAGASTSALSDAEIRQRLEQAKAELAMDSSSSQGIAAVDAPCDAPRLQVISSDYNPTETFTALARCSDSNAKLPMMISRMDDDEYSPTCHENEDVDFLAGVLLYNYAIAFECLSGAMRSASEKDDDALAAKNLQVRANMIFHLAIYQLYNQCLDQRDDSAALFSLGRLLQFKAYLTHSLMQSCQQLGLMDEANEHRHTLTTVLRMMEARETMLRTTAHWYAAAA